MNLSLGVSILGYWHLPGIFNNLVLFRETLFSGFVSSLKSNQPAQLQKLHSDVELDELDYIGNKPLLLYHVRTGAACSKQVAY